VSPAPPSPVRKAAGFSPETRKGRKSMRKQEIDKFV
jgi:hypothetical protein